MLWIVPCALVGAVLSIASIAPAVAQTTGPMRLIVPFAAGGPTDIAARIIAPFLGQAYKRPMIVENKVGATGAIGAERKHHLAGTVPAGQHAAGSDRAPACGA